MKITKDQIIATALDLLNEVGLDALTTRLLADRLGVQQPALYWHFKSRQDLKEAMNIEILARGHHYVLPQPGEIWQDFVVKNARSFHTALLAYRDGARVHAGTRASAQQLDQFETVLTFLTHQGMSLATAVHLGMSASILAVGSILDTRAEQEGRAELATTAELAGTAELTKTAEAAFAVKFAPYPLIRAGVAHLKPGSNTALFESGLRLLIAGAEAEIAANAAPKI